jgi:hypothetical protein
MSTNDLKYMTHIYREVYAAAPDSTVTPVGEVGLFDNYEKLLEHLRTKNICVCPDLRVIHGILTSAKSIPRNLRNRQAFILLFDPKNEGQGVLLDSAAEDNCQELATEIQNLLASEEAASFAFEIDDVYILYGYELNVVMSVDEDDIDEEIISTCKEIAEDAEKLEDSRGEA